MKECLICAIRAAVSAGNKISVIYNDPAADFRIEKKADDSPLTIADKAAHAEIVSRLEEMPYPVLSEEGCITSYAERKAWPTLWIVDPLDGTKEFIRRNGEFTVNIALVRNGVPVLGVIYVPEKRRLYFGAEGYGAFRVDSVRPEEEAAPPVLISEGIRLPLRLPARPFRVVASRSHLNPETLSFIDRLKESHPDLETVSSGSSLKICLVAEGTADVYPRFAPTMEWDTAAGHAIARAAGAEIYVADRRDEVLRYNKENLLNPGFVAERKK